MPIHQYPDHQFSKAYKQEELPQHHVDMRRLSEESIRTVYCDGPALETAMDDVTIQKGNESSMTGNGEAVCSDRAELIERIKRGESPTWIPSQAQCASTLYDGQGNKLIRTRSPRSVGLRIGNLTWGRVANGVLVQLQEEYLKTNNRDVSTVQRQPSGLRTPPLRPAAELRIKTQKQEHTPKDGISIPLEIQKLRSAFHAGDFKEEQREAKETSEDSPRVSRRFDAFQKGPLGTSPTTPWYHPPSSFKQSVTSPQVSPTDQTFAISDQRPWRSRAPSFSSYSLSSYVLKAPTTPLVQQSNNTDLDFSPTSLSVSPKNRRHTFTPNTLQDMQSSSGGQSSQAARHPMSHRRESSFPYGHHQRRSLTSNWSLQASSSPQTPPNIRPRRISFSSEASPRQHAHMVGSYEESILRGWMSTAPSKPLDFTAQIGVLGKGNCKPKCPAHVTIPFPAVFYSWSAGNGRSSRNDDPSPYVGHIDLQHSLSPPEPEQPPSLPAESVDGSQTNLKHVEHDTTGEEVAPRRFHKRRRTSPASTPPQGSYRIPEQGQLQIIIKNPNKTAVKLFLIPYDLSGMESGTKTFVRQRSYSADAYVDGALASKTPPDPAFVSGKSTLRYLIHLNICSPSKGHFYLYQQIRVVFANRVPDNKEQLRNEIQVPQPRFSVYKPTRNSLCTTGSSVGAKLTAEKAYRRRSSGFGFGSDEAGGRATQTFSSGSVFPFDTGTPVPPVPAIPFDLAVSRQRAYKSQESSNGEAMDFEASRRTTASDLQWPLNDQSSDHAIGTQLSSSYKSNSSSNGSDSYNKLIKGDSGYGGVFGRPRTPERGEGLLARRLKKLCVQRDSRAAEEEA